MTNLGTSAARNAHLSARAFPSMITNGFQSWRKPRRRVKRELAKSMAVVSVHPQNQIEKKTRGIIWLLSTHACTALLGINRFFFSIFPIFNICKEILPWDVSGVSREVSSTFINTWGVRFFLLFSQTQTSRHSFLIIVFSFLGWNIFWKWKTQCCQVSPASEERKRNSWHKGLNSDAFF